MSYDNYSIVYHLTPDGWKAEREGVIPSDRLLTAELEVTQSSGFGRENRVWRRLWASPELSDVEIASLEQTFPKARKADRAFIEKPTKAIRQSKWMMVRNW